MLFRLKGLTPANIQALRPFADYCRQSLESGGEVEVSGTVVIEIGDEETVRRMWPVIRELFSLNQRLRLRDSGLLKVNDESDISDLALARTHEASWRRAGINTVGQMTNSARTDGRPSVSREAIRSARGALSVFSLKFADEAPS